MNSAFDDSAYWSDAWKRHIEGYLAAPPRAGFWLARHFDPGLTYLEIAGGSCRDSRYLASLGCKAVGSDFDEKTLQYVKSRFAESPLELVREDAFSFSFPDQAFDISFSNGFWVLFNDDQRVAQLMREQARVTRRYMIALVHNIENRRLIGTFAERAKRDSLYDIRFFNRNEIYKLLAEAGIQYKSVETFKFGGPMDRLFAPRVKGMPNVVRPRAPRLVPLLYRLQSWSTTERVGWLIRLR